MWNPIAETRRAVDDFGPFTEGDDDLVAELTRSAGSVREVVPECVGLTLALVSEGLAFTLLATDADVAVLDGMQYLDGGPCVDAADRAETVTFDAEDPTDEDRWGTFARASAARGVASTLTLPLLEDGVVRGSVNLYASTAGAFDGHHEEVARIFGAWAPGAVADADLDLDMVRTARQAPQLLAADLAVSRAIGVLMARDGIDAETARDHLTEAAVRAGVELTALAETVLRSWQSEH